MVYSKNIYKKENRCGYRFVNLDPEGRKKLFLLIFSSPQTWEHAHDLRPRRSIVMAWHYLTGLVNCCLPKRTTRRFHNRELMFSPATVKIDNSEVSVLMYDSSEYGVSVICYSHEKPKGLVWSLTEAPEKTARHVYTKKIFPNIWRIGLDLGIGGITVRQKREFSEMVES